APETGTFYLRMAALDNSNATYRIRTGVVLPGPVGRGRDQRDVFVCSSPDGATWTTPTMVNDDEPRFDGWLPEISVSDQGDVFVLWYDWRDVPGDSPDGACGGLSSAMMARSQGAGATWSQLGAVSDART